ncbi:MAG: phosphatidylserine decarboxylase [Spirochaetota bacterium]|jgi:phosphatidylserine decarboxylase|nr:phosphatidylserine decarboxylase [Spirochaetota bacterium]
MSVLRSIIHAFCEAPVLCLALFALIPLGFLLHILAACIPAILFVLALFFFRDPERATPRDDAVLYASADGKVLRMEEAEYAGISGGKGWRVLIFMSPLNVHRNRAPMHGRVQEVRYKKGEFLPAFREGMHLVNERASVVFQSPDDASRRVVVTQIAGILARRIVCRAEVGVEYAQGEQFGLIRFGSANEMIFDSEWQPLVQEGTRVRAGVTVIARRKA